MRRRPMSGWMLLWGSLLGMVWLSTAHADLTVEQERELADIRRNLLQVPSLLRRDQLDEAEKSIDAAEARLKQLAKDASLPPDSPVLTGMHKLVATRRHALELRRNPKKGKQPATVSFVQHVAPILNARCVECHSDEASGKLKLDSYAGMKKGGQSGPLLFVGRPERSLFMLRLCTPIQQQRMPKNDEPLSAAELNVLALWIKQGAKFDGLDEETELAELLKPKEELPPIKGFEPTGKETVSFKKEIAPWMVTYCLRCHSGKEPEGGLSLETFEGLMRGGDRGKVVVPGDAGNSLIYQLVGSFDEAKRMPANSSKLLRKNWDDLGRWIHEGAKYDGGDPRLLIRALNPTEGQVRAEELAAFDAEDFIKFRQARTEEQWKLAFSDEEPHTATSQDLLLFGNVSEGRVGEVQEWADEHLATLRKLFEGESDQLLWKGRLAIFVLKNRSDFEKFNETVTQRRVLAGSHADINLTGTFEDAFLVLEDTGDESDGKSPTLQFNLLEQLTAAYVMTLDARYPEWLTLGLGPALAAAEADRRDAYVESLRIAAAESVSELSKPNDVFRDGVFFSSDDARPMGFTLVEFLLKRGGGERQFVSFLKTLADGGDVGNTLRVVYRADPDPIARNFLATLKGKRQPND